MMDTGTVAFTVNGPPNEIPVISKSVVPALEIERVAVCTESAVTSPKETAQGSMVMLGTPRSSVVLVGLVWTGGPAFPPQAVVMMSAPSVSESFVLDMGIVFLKCGSMP